MMIKKCCVYTVKDFCPKCGSATRTAHPPKFSSADKYAKYRRAAKANKEAEE